MVAGLQLVEMLLERCSSQNIHEAALQAISEDHTSIAEQILRHGNYLELCRKRHRLGDIDGFFKTEVESQFSTDITPLNLAAQKNNYAIVQLLLLRGDSIQKVGILEGKEIFLKNYWLWQCGNYGQLVVVGKVDISEDWG